MQKLAKIFSAVLHPLLIPIYVVALLLFTNTIYSFYPMRLKVYLMWVVVLYSTVLPLLSFELIKRLFRLRGREIRRRYKTTIITLIVACCYVLFAVTMMRSPSLVIFRKIAVTALMCGVFCMGVSHLTRISYHLTAMGAAVAFFVMLNIAGEQAMFWVLLGTLLATGVIASVRLYMGRHRSLQLLEGFVGGFTICAVTMLYI